MAELVIGGAPEFQWQGREPQAASAGFDPSDRHGGGKDKESVPVVIDRHAVTELLKQEKGRNTVFLLKMKGTKQERHAMVRDAQIDPITRQYIHLDFIRVMKGQRLKVEVPIVLHGEAEGVKVGGFLDWVGRSLHVECPAEEIPQAFHVDISNLQLSQHLTAADIPLPENAKLADDAHKVIVTCAVHHVKLEEEVKPAEEAAATAAPEEVAEPEVIKRGKAATEEVEEAE
jgi:large subunit ribosomal protein L25